MKNLGLKALGSQTKGDTLEKRVEKVSESLPPGNYHLLRKCQQYPMFDNHKYFFKKWNFMSISERIISEGWAHSTSDPITFQFPLDQVLTKRLNDWLSKRRKIRDIHILWFSLKTNVKTFRFSGMLLLSDWLQDFWDICGGFGLGEGEATFVHLFDRQIKEMWYLCESISLRVWVMDKGNKFSLPHPMHWSTYIECHKFQHSWSLFEIYDSHIFQFPLQTGSVQYPHYKPTHHPWGILHFSDVSKIGLKYFTKP